MIKATIHLNNGKVLNKEFSTKRVKTVWNACTKELGRPKENIVFNNRCFWVFDDGMVEIEGYVKICNRTDTNRIRKEARLEKQTWRAA